MKTRLNKKVERNAFINMLQNKRIFIFSYNNLTKIFINQLQLGSLLFHKNTQNNILKNEGKKTI